MDLVNDLFKYNHVFIKYMDQVKLYDDDYRILDRFQGFLNILEEFKENLGYYPDMRQQAMLRKNLNIVNPFELDESNYLVSKLKVYACKLYLENKG